MGRANIKQQLKNAIRDANGIGQSKRIDRLNGVTEKKVYGYETKTGLMNTAEQYANFIKDYSAKNDCSIRQIKELDSNITKAFLEHQAKTNSQNTLNKTMSHLRTIEQLCEQKYNCSMDFKYNNFKKEEPEEKQRSIRMDREDFNKLEKHLETKKECESQYGIKLAEAFGLRASEVCKIQMDHIKDNTLEIVDSKGGRDRTLDIRTDHQKEVLEELKSYAEDKDRYGTDYAIQVKPDSVNDYLKRSLEEIGITKYNEANTGIHSIRKMYATERCEELVANGKSENDAWGTTSEELGHSYDRLSLKDVYWVK